MPAPLRRKADRHIQSGASSKAVSLVLSRGVPVALWAPSFETEEEAMLGLTESKAGQAHSIPAGTIVSSTSGTVDDFTLAGFINSLATVNAIGGNTASGRCWMTCLALTPDWKPCKRHDPVDAQVGWRRHRRTFARHAGRSSQRS